MVCRGGPPGGPLLPTELQVWLWDVFLPTVFSPWHGTQQSFNWGHHISLGPTVEEMWGRAAANEVGHDGGLIQTFTVSTEFCGHLLAQQDSASGWWALCVRTLGAVLKERGLGDALLCECCRIRQQMSIDVLSE